MDFPIVSTHKPLIEAIKKITKITYPSLVPYHINSEAKTFEYFKSYMPEFLILDLSCQQINAQDILERFDSDRLLYYGCIVTVYSEAQSEIANEYTRKYINILCAIPIWRFAVIYHSVLQILKQNPRFSVSWSFQRYALEVVSNTFVINNDPDNIFAYSHIITRLLERFGLVNRETSDIYNVVISELLMNAIEHGNCQISYGEKKAWLENHSNTRELIRNRASSPETKDKKVYISYEIHRNFNRVIIEDQGPGFDWRSALGHHASTTPKTHGFGIAVVRAHVQKLHYNDIGNRVTVELKHTAPLANLKTPPLFNKGREMQLKAGDILMHEHTESRRELYFILSGTLVVSKNGEYLAQLDSSDLFCGEMDFLLGTRRPTASVHAKSTCKVIAIQYKDFLKSVRNEPYYTLLLARLITERLYRNNNRLVTALAKMQQLKSRYAKNKTSR